MNTLVSETSTHTITGLLDFEWSHFGPQSDEYFVRYLPDLSVLSVFTVSLSSRAPGRE